MLALRRLVAVALSQGSLPTRCALPTANETDFPGPQGPQWYTTFGCFTGSGWDPVGLGMQVDTFPKLIPTPDSHVHAGSNLLAVFQLKAC